MDTNYLINLLDQRTTDYDDIMGELKRRLKVVPLKQLLKKWYKVENPMLKDLFEIAISERIRDFEMVVDYQDYPKTLKKYIEEVTSFDAIWTLMTVRNEEVSRIAKMKCYAFIEQYMDTFDDKKLYELEGDDTYLFKLASDSCVIKIPKRIKVSKQSIKQNEVGKIYQFKKIGGDKNDKY